MSSPGKQHQCITVCLQCYLDIKNEIDESNLYNVAAVCMWTKVYRDLYLECNWKFKKCSSWKSKRKPNYKYIKTFSLRSDMLLLSKWPNITGLIYSSLSMIIQVKVALNRAVVDSDWRFGNLCCSHVQSKSESYHVSWWLLQDLSLTYSKSSFDFSTNLLHLILSLLRISVIYYFELI